MDRGVPSGQAGSPLITAAACGAAGAVIPGVLAEAGADGEVGLGVLIPNYTISWAEV